MPTVRTNQRDTRQTGLDARRQLTTSYREFASDRICESIRTSRRFRTARAVALYWPMPDEVDVLHLIDCVGTRSCRVFLPVVKKNKTLGFAEVTADTQLRRNQYGIPEPDFAQGAEISPRLLDLVVTPLSAFDDSQNRVGMGGGYYDKTFAFRRHRRNWQRPRLIGVAFDVQRVAPITMNRWDVRIDAIVTEHAVYSGSGVI